MVFLQPVRLVRVFVLSRLLTGRTTRSEPDSVRFCRLVVARIVDVIDIVVDRSSHFTGDKRNRFGLRDSSTISSS